MDIILASTSPYRRELLKRLHLPFQCVPPLVEEQPLPGEAPDALAGRLALEKARAVAAQHPTALVIGSDQVAALDAQLLGKPGNHDNAVAQLTACSGRAVQFHTGLALVCADRAMEKQHVEPFEVQFRELEREVIERYLTLEQPYDCAGSFKCEGLGIALFTRLEGRDPTSLQGLPLIALTAMLEEAGYSVI